MHIALNPTVEEALRHNQPVVALESTVITHGLPYPDNIMTATEMENAVIQGGALPATLAIIEGQIKVGLTADEIENLGKQAGKNIRKTSRRDLPIVVALRQSGATTVSGTMVIAHRVGIKVFATGGIGGVHLGHPFDVSADLTELGQTPVSVVCSGAKSILDLPLTFEVLETNGVPVIGYQTDRIPAFYTRDSGLAVDERVNTPEQAAEIIHHASEMKMQNGILFCVPVPEENALPEQLAKDVIKQATEEADRQGIRGKDITPFVLKRIQDLTGGYALDANKALLINNGRVAAQIAQAYSRLNQLATR